MKKIVKLAIVAMFAISGVFATIMSNTQTASALSTASPRLLYLQNCAMCHGANGKAQTKRGLKLGATDLTSDDVQNMDRAKIIRAINNGRTGMPSFKKKLTTRQTEQIADRVLAF